jgi:hypothetical protein
MEENRGLLFIPDYQRLYPVCETEMEIDHTLASHIIQELLDILINANYTGLEISEIEGGCHFFFYKYVRSTGS